MFSTNRFVAYTSIMITAMFFLTMLPPQASGIADMEEPYWTIAQDPLGSDYVQMSEDGKILVSVDNQLTLSVFDLEAKEKLWDYMPEEGLSPYNSFALSSDGSILVVADSQGKLFYLDITKGKDPIWTFNATGYIDMAINSNGTLLYVVRWGAITTFGEEGLIENYGPDLDITGGAQVVMAADTGKVMVYDDFFSWSKSSPMDDWYVWDSSVTLEKVMMADDGSSTLFVYGDGKVMVSKTTSSGGKNWPLDLPFDVFSLNILMSQDGSTIVVERENYPESTLYVIDVASEMIVWEKTFSGTGYFTISGDGQLIMYSYGWSKITRAIDKWTGEPLGESGFEFGDLCLVSYDGSTVVLTSLNMEQYGLNVFKEPVTAIVEEDDDGQLEMFVMIGLAIAVINLVLLVILLVRKK